MSIERVRIQDFSPGLIREYLSWLGHDRHCGISTRNQRLATLRAFFKYVEVESPQHILLCQKIINIPYTKKEQASVCYLNYKPIISNRYNCSGFSYGYDAQGNETDTWYIGTDGKPMVRKDRGYAHYHEDFDAYGRTSSVSYFDMEEKPAISKQTGCATVKCQYDEKGQCILKTYYGLDGTPIISTTDSCAGIAYSYDTRGNQTGTAC